ncbi:MAG TPA: hypothetical protein VGF54_00495 [Streptosporangiaceae bacterium]
MSRQPFHVAVPPGRRRVTGDHRVDPDDSRGDRDDPGPGTIPERAVAGRAFLITWLPAQLGFLPAHAPLSRSSLLHRQPGPPHCVTGTPAGRARVAALRGRR